MTDNIDFEPIVKELYSALDGKVSEDILRKELEKYIVTYKTGVTIAKDSILKRFNGSRPAGTFVSSAGVTKKISELEGTEMSVNLVAKVVDVVNKTVNIKGTPRNIVSGTLGDDTGTAVFTIWNDIGVTLVKDSVYSIKNAYTKKWQDQVQINIGTRARVEENNEVTFQAPMSAISSAPSGSSAVDMKICDITENTKNVNVVGVISGVSSRTIVVKGAEKTIFGGIIADNTGKIQFTDWEDHTLKDGETISVKNAYIRAWKGIPQLNIGNSAIVERSQMTINAVSSGPTVKTVEEVMKVGGGLDLSITGTIVDIRSGSGLIKRCPQCNRSVLGEECSIHGRIEPVMDLRLKLTIDDGTGAISAIINRNDTEKLTGITLDQATDMAREKGDMGVVANKMTSILLLKKVTVSGNIMSDEFGPQMSVRKTETVSIDVTAEAEKLFDAVEAKI